jgi:uncharacterized protein YcgL (UPF0745 family)
MLCAIYKSSKKSETYLYVEKRDDFSKVPEPLMETFGNPQFVMLFNLAGEKQLMRFSNEKVRTEITEKGFYLQLPPKTESLLDAHKQAQANSEQPGE